MNQSQIVSIITIAVTSAAAGLLSKYGVTNTEVSGLVTDIVAAGAIVWGIIAHQLHGTTAGAKSAANIAAEPPGNNITKILPAVLFVGLVSSFASGCVAYQNTANNGYATVVQERWVGAHIATTSSSAGSPDVKFGWGSSIVTIYPVSTNSLYAAALFSTFDTTTSWNPLDIGVNETFGAGPVAASIGTNGATSASNVVPKLSLKKQP